jgi:serine/threonine protein kinase/tetratricopeptide (TPR) repeat protein
MNEREIFINALKHEAAEREAYLAQACGGDFALRKRIEALLAEHAQLGSFMESPSPALAKSVDESSHPPDGFALGPGARIGPYKLLEQIGEGGMGVVFMAAQTHPVERNVALKLIKPGLDTRQVISRFEAERQALALMDHPNIAKVFDAGSTETGQPYFVMELVNGIPITEYCDSHRLTPAERLELFIPVCKALQHAHQKGIIHRDLKPSNVLVVQYDGKPVPKVIDFGVAKATGPKLTDQTEYTGFGTVVGTLEYMSPEQAVRNQLDVDTRSDIYSLGVVLYELLTGSTPLDHKRAKRAAILELLRIIQDEDPPKPSARLSTTDELPSIAAHRGLDPKKLSGLVRGDLDWIVMKALEKDRARRYETANGLARDLDRYLHDEPVEACPPSAAYRFRKFARRNRLAFAAALLVLLAILLGTIVSTTEAIRAIRAERLAEARLLAETEARREAEAARQAEAAQRRIAETQRTLAEAQKTRAEANFRKARQAVDEYVTVVSESKLFDVPGLQPLRRQLLEAALRYYQGFLDQRSSDPKLRAELAATYLRVANIDEQIDRSDDAIKALARGVEIARDVLRTNPELTDLPQQLAGVRRGGRIAHMWENWPSDMPQAVRIYRQAADIWEKLVAANPASDELRSDLAAFYRRIGDLEWGLAASARALPDFQKASEIWDKLTREKPAAPEFRADLAETLDHLGKVLKGTGRPTESEVSYRRAMAIREKLVADFPNVPEYRAGLANGLNRFGDALKSFDRPDEAETAYRRSIEMFEKLTAEFPDFPAYRKILAAVDRRLGNLLKERGRAEEAVTAYWRALELQGKLAAEFPDNAGDSVDEFTETCQILTRFFSSIGRLEEVQRVYQRTYEWITTSQKLATDVRQGPKYRAMLAAHHSMLAGASRKLGKTQEAEESYRKALSMRERLVADYPTEGSYRLALAETEFDLATLYSKTGRKTDAEVSFKTALSVIEKLVAAPQPGLDVADLLKRTADGFAAAGDPTLAEGAIQKAIVLNRRLAKESPDEPRHLWDLGHALRILAFIVQSRPGRLADAEHAFSEAEKVFEQLPDRYPRPPDSASFLADTRLCLGDLLAGSNRTEAAETTFRRATKSFEKLVADFPHNQEFRNQLAQTHLKVAEMLRRQGKQAEATKEKLAAEKLQSPNGTANAEKRR